MIKAYKDAWGNTQYKYIPLSEQLPDDWDSWDIENKALCYAEEYGIVEYHISGNKMIYYISYYYEHRTYKAIVNLEKAPKEKRTALKGYYKPYKSKIGGKYYACMD